MTLIDQNELLAREQVLAANMDKIDKLASALLGEHVQLKSRLLEAQARLVTAASNIPPASPAKIDTTILDDLISHSDKLITMLGGDPQDGKETLNASTGADETGVGAATLGAAPDAVTAIKTQGDPEAQAQAAQPPAVQVEPDAGLGPNPDAAMMGSADLPDA